MLFGIYTTCRTCICHVTMIQSSEMPIIQKRSQIQRRSPIATETTWRIVPCPVFAYTASCHLAPRGATILALLSLSPIKMFSSSRSCSRRSEQESHLRCKVSRSHRYSRSPKLVPACWLPGSGTSSQQPSSCHFGT